MIFVSARVKVLRIMGGPVATVISRTDLGIGCKCGCGGYWLVDVDGWMKPYNRYAFLAHDLEPLEVVDQLAFRVEAS